MLLPAANRMPNLLCTCPAIAGRMHVQYAESAEGGMELAHKIADALEQAMQLRSTPVPQAVAIMGRNCHMPNALTTPLHVVLHMEASLGIAVQAAADSSPEPELQQYPTSGTAEGGLTQQETQYVRAVRLALREGGCCASRASYVGACMGALLGKASVPHSWLDRYQQYRRAQEWASRVVGLRSASIDG